MNPRPCDTEALDRGTAPIRVGHVDYPGKSDKTVASNCHMAIVIEFAEFTSETLKTPGHIIANPVSLIFRYIRVGLMRFNTLHEFNIRRLLKTALRTSSSQNTGLFNMAIAILAIHQDRRWFMGIVHLKCYARPRARRPGDPPALRRRHTKPEWQTRRARIAAPGN